MSLSQQISAMQKYDIRTISNGARQIFEGFFLIDKESVINAPSDKPLLCFIMHQFFGWDYSNYNDSLIYIMFVDDIVIGGIYDTKRRLILSVMPIIMSNYTSPYIANSEIKEIKQFFYKY